MKKKLLVVCLFVFCYFPFFAKTLDMNSTQTEPSQSIESQESEKKKESGKVFDSNQHTEIIESIKRKKEQNQFLQTAWKDSFFEIGSLFNEDSSGIIVGRGLESKSKNSYIIWQNCFDLIYYENNFDFRWIPTIFLGNHTIKIGAGIPLGTGIYSYTEKDNSYTYLEEEDELDLSLSIGIRPSAKLTIKNVAFEIYYQYLAKVFISCDTIKLNEIGLMLKFNL